MIGLPSHTKIWLAAGVTDMRSGFNRLAAKVQTVLERGRFVWPRADGGVVCLSQAQLSMLLEGIDWRQPVRTTEPTSAL
ncbi:IS66 Orf2 family protein [Burkholderia pseudomallei]|uniref:IS66 family insertion sequence element accessory protein TnpB n=1 Tax=Burkholderia pseudomallei TaxID=28450 RepID=UPI000F0551F9|nr:IS66 family insertion sequence element accessory protein TnpB [Burkholderia pseudomallei]CAJ3326117.1 IS66 Orf2 family protein [Burkholderia pseudomallei]VBS58899.1 IS66 Orf2 family protein [Burkholderia pseudomallei]